MEESIAGLEGKTCGGRPPDAFQMPPEVYQMSARCVPDALT